MQRRSTGQVVMFMVMGMVMTSSWKAQIPGCVERESMISCYDFTVFLAEERNRAARTERDSGGFERKRQRDTETQRQRKESEIPLRTGYQVLGSHVVQRPDSTAPRRIQQGKKSHLALSTHITVTSVWSLTILCRHCSGFLERSPCQFNSAPFKQAS